MAPSDHLGPQLIWITGAPRGPLANNPHATAGGFVSGAKTTQRTCPAGFRLSCLGCTLKWCGHHAIESINARLRGAVRARGHFPTEQAALKCLYLAVISLDPTGKGRQRWMGRWKAALNAFDITFDGRLSAGHK